MIRINKWKLFHSIHIQCFHAYLIQLFSKEHFYAVFFQDLIFSSFLKTCNVEKCFINQLYQKIMGEAVPQMLLSEQTQDENMAIFGLQMKVW